MPKIINQIYNRTAKSFAAQRIETEIKNSNDMAQRLAEHFWFKQNLIMNWKSSILP